MGTVLVVDDSNDDLLLIRRAIKKLSFPVDLRTVDCGEKALGYVKGHGDFTFNPTPDLMILDLKMPRMNGFEVLADLQAASLSHRPAVVVMSSSGLAQDVERAYSLGAAAFYTKPTDFTQLCAILLTVVPLFCAGFPNMDRGLPCPSILRIANPSRPTVLSQQMLQL